MGNEPALAAPRSQVAALLELIGKLVEVACCSDTAERFLTGFRPSFQGASFCVLRLSCLEPLQVSKVCLISLEVSEPELAYSREQVLLMVVARFLTL